MMGDGGSKYEFYHEGHEGLEGLKDEAFRSDHWVNTERALSYLNIGYHRVCRIFSSSGEQGLEKGLTIVIPRQVNPSCISSLIRRRQ